MTRQNFSDKILTARYEHCGYRCEGVIPETGERCSADIRLRKWHGDHNIPDRAGGKPTFENCRCLCIPCHKTKTVADQKIIAKVRRVEAKHAGFEKPGKRKMQGRGFQKVEKPEKGRSAKVVARRPMFEETNHGPD